MKVMQDLKESLELDLNWELEPELETGLQQVLL
jgi:hypothetical protein